MSLRDVSVFRAPADIVERTEEALRKAGREGYELFVLWTGRVEGKRFNVLNAHVPKQTSYKTKEGLMVRVEGEALHRLNAWLYENEEILGVQIHAHPDEAYHSRTDDTFPIVTVEGGLSVVAPEFCRDQLLGVGSKMYRLDDEGWTETHDAIEVYA